MLEGNKFEMLVNVCQTNAQGEHFFRRAHVKKFGHGLCGDPSGPNEDHMDGGRFANGFMTASYRPNQDASFEVTVAAHHGGYFEFHLWYFDIYSAS